MPRLNSLKILFTRNRRPGDIVFAWVLLAVSVFLLMQLFDQAAFKKGARLFAQPRFWPAVSLGGMVFFASAHLISAMLSKRIAGRWQEVGLWLSSLEYASWFIAYAIVMPFGGYLPTTVLFALILAVRVGYRSQAALLAAALSAIAITLVFKTFLKVKLPAGKIYEILPDGLRQIMLIYF